MLRFQSSARGWPAGPAAAPCRPASPNPSPTAVSGQTPWRCRCLPAARRAANPVARHPDGCVHCRDLPVSAANCGPGPQLWKRALRRRPQCSRLRLNSCGAAGRYSPTAAEIMYLSHNTRHPLRCPRNACARFSRPTVDSIGGTAAAFVAVENVVKLLPAGRPTHRANCSGPTRPRHRDVR